MTNPDVPSSQTPPLRSEFASDVEMREIVEEFVAEMPAKVRALMDGWTSQELDRVQRLAHQLKGAAGGYGFPTLSGAAGSVEEQLRALSEGSLRGSTAELRRTFDELVELCRRVTV